MESTTTPGAGAPTPASPRPAPSKSAAQDCANCGARLTADQRYCVECGERRGEPRFSIVDAIGKPQSAPPPPRRRRPSLSANSSLIAGVATLLIAMGVGVLIGRTGRDSSAESASNQPVKVLSVPGAATAGTTAAAGAASGKAKKAKSSSKKQSTVVNPQASSAEGQPAEELPPSTVGIGDKGQGAGYKDGKFTGDFFGP